MVLAAAALAAVATPAFAPARAQQQPATVAVVLSAHPAAAAVPAAMIRAGIEAAAAVANEEEAGRARPVRLVYADDQGTPAGAAEAAAKLLADGAPVALIGGQSSPVTAPQIAAAARAGRPFVNVNGWDPGLRLTGIADAFHVAPDAWTVPEALARSAAAIGAARVVLVAAAERGAAVRAEPVQAALGALRPPLEAPLAVLDVAARPPVAAAALRREPPDLLIALTPGAAGARLLAGLRAAGVAPTAGTLVLDGAGIADAPGFWDDARDAGRLLLSVALQHPGIALTPRGAAARKRLPTDMAETRLFHQGADALFALVDGLRAARGGDPAALVRALDTGTAMGTRGPVRFRTEIGPRYRQRLEVPFALVQHVETGAPAARARAVWVPGQPFDAARLARPAARPTGAPR
ncbi:MAG: ABC transporter substrate-binding protein [Alphaproteobacteria bacterium]|nr:ABC transporter substrate-binding protein [Alphaproteobacteria bacterium]